MSEVHSPAARLLTRVYRESLQSLGGRALVRAALSTTPIPALRVRLFALGKAACAMAFGASESLRVEFSGVVAAHERSPHPRQLSLHLGGHPIPTRASVQTGQALWDAVEATRPEDFAIFLISGGASAIAALPVAPLSIEELAATTDALLRSGAPIDAINQVRKHLTRLGGGRLAAQCRARRGLVLMLSDIASGDIGALASGPTLPDPSTFADALDIIERHGAQVPRSVLDCLARGRDGLMEETPKPGDARLGRLRHRLLASPSSLADKACQLMSAQGVFARAVTASFDGDLKSLADVFVREAHAQESSSDRRPLLLVASGEPRLCVPSARGSGGRMQHLALSLAQSLAGHDFCALCAGSDGRDGDTDFAGAIVDGQTAQRALSRGVDLARHLDGFDSSTAVRALRLGLDRFLSGTNLTDLALVLVGASKVEGAIF